LRAPLDVVLGRIRKRGRSFEKDIEPGYLSRLMQAYDRFFSEFNSSPVLTIETEDLNFPDREEHISFVMDAVGETLNQKKSTHLVNAGERKQQKLFS
jgi:deoxyadenosine/deoxycytidine kinase